MIVPFLKRDKRDSSLKRPASGLSSGSGLLNVLAPMAFDFRQRQLTMGDMLCRVLVVTGYPPNVEPAWLSRVVTLPGVFSSIHVTPTDPYQLINSINNSIGELAGKLETTGKALYKMRAQKSLKDAETMLKKIDQENQNVFYVTVIFLVLASDEDTLNRRSKRLESALAAPGMRGRALIFRQEEGLLAAGPWAVLPEKVSRAGRRNMVSETVAASFPFAAGGIKDGFGILLGRDKYGGIVLLDIWRRGGDRPNSSLLVLGKPGVGKSFTVKLILYREYLQGSKIIMIDPEREYRDLCMGLGGSWINCAGGSGRINPLQVRLYPVDEDEAGKDGDKRALGPLFLHIQFLRTFFSLYLRDLSDVEKALLEDALVELYAGFCGVTWDTEFEAIRGIPAEKWPNTRDLYELVAEKAESDPELWRRLAILLKRAGVGSDAALWAGPTTARVDSDVIVLDIFNLMNADNSVKKAQYFNVLSYAWHIIETDRMEKVFFGVDEAYLLVDPQTPQTLEFLRNTNKRIRKYSGSLGVITQNVSDFLDPEVKRHGGALLNNPTYKLFLGQGEDDLEALSSLLRLSEAEQDLLISAERGEGLLVAGNQRIRMNIEASAHEIALFGSGGGM
ncbi:hypothetical protein DCCM_4536 [Desulfocucumis palustris]|uniref:TraG P-loop domain-containing protein n=1 Tax=Desulfocucumis palustris TaxID=1898651 RepID=A0A2L2XGC6_9FIRM|nr:ATP-binding protein [Desulfocucumis palustris]GBF35409.1 hypothetical protein DCCM_4536 [Desulfocucumis palustris]